MELLRKTRGYFPEISMPKNGVREWWRPIFLYRLHWVPSFLSGSQDPHRRVKCVSLCFLFNSPQAATQRDSQGGQQESPYPSMPPDSQSWSCCRFICAWFQEFLSTSPHKPQQAFTCYLPGRPENTRWCLGTKQTRCHRNKILSQLHAAAIFPFPCPFTEVFW